MEAEVTKWQVLVDKVRGDAPPDFDNQTLAVLRGRLVRYLMRSKEVHKEILCSPMPRTRTFVQLATFFTPTSTSRRSRSAAARRTTPWTSTSSWRDPHGRSAESES